MKARSIKGRSTAEIQAELELNINDGFTPTLAIVFISIKQDRQAIKNMLRKNQIDILGATSCGEFINGYQDEGTIVILLLELARELYSIQFSHVGDGDIHEIAGALASDALRQFARPIFALETRRCTSWKMITNYESFSSDSSANIANVNSASC